MKELSKRGRRVIVLAKEMSEDNKGAVGRGRA